MISGKTDIVADKNRAICIDNGHPMMQKVTGTGCMLSVVTAAFIVACPENVFEAAAAAVCTMGLAGEIAHKRLKAGEGNMTYRNNLIDAIYTMTAEQLEQGARYAMR